MRKRRQQNRGFTLIELLIVIIIIAAISAILIATIKPAETVKKVRDTQRMSDLNTIKSVVEYIQISNKTPDLSQLPADCLQDGGTQAKIFYSYNKDTITCNGAVTAGADAAGKFYAGNFCSNVIGSAASKVDGSGWIPINFKLAGDVVSISRLPLDPSNSIANSSSPTQTDLVYRYACQTKSFTKPGYVFEIDASLESDAYTITSDKRTDDGGDNDSMFEVGTNLGLLPTSGDF